MASKIFTLILLHIFVLPIFTQRWARQGVQRCYTPDNYIGVCLTLTNCPSVALFYGANRNSPQIIPYLTTLKRNCGNRVIGNDPVVCCKDGYRNPPRITTEPPYIDDESFESEPTPPVRISTPPPVRTRPTTEAPIPTIAPVPLPTAQARLSGKSCFGPDAVEGFCTDLKQCPVLLNRLKANPTDATFAQFLRQSNTLCENVYSQVCCPSEDNNGGTSGENENPITSSPPNNEPIGKTFINTLPTPQDGCGITKNTFKKIVGGVTAQKGAWPWAALLGYSTSDGIDFKCGGALISSRHVLTAAHCIRNDLRIVRLGEHDLKTDTETQHLDVTVSRTEKHADYSRRDGFADIAIVYLERNVPFTNTIKPICLPQSSSLRFKSYVDFSPFVVGWGKTQEGGQSATVLQELQIPVYNNTVCINSYAKKSRYISRRQFGETVLCAGVLEGGKDTCQGDSGGPLMIPEPIGGKHYFFELGVVSYGIGCARADIPGVYTSVQYYMDWIQQKVAETT